MMTPKRLLRNLRDAKAARNKLVKVWRHKVQLPEGAKVQCRGKGCVGCCYQFVLAGIWEGALIAHYLLHTEGSHELIQECARAGDEQLERVGPEYTPDAINAVTGPWLDERHPCVFLKDGVCEIYALRPIACSSYVVISDPEVCAAGSGAEVCAGDNASCLAWRLEVDRRLVSELLSIKRDDVVVMPLPLPRAVTLGSQLLLEGPEALRGIVLGESNP